MDDTARKPWRRSPPPPAWASPFITAIAFTLYWPLSKLFPKRWPHWIGRLMTRFLSQWPTDYRPDARDVLVCSYYKSGTNWTMQIAVQVAHRGRAEFEHVHDLVPWPDMAARAGYTVPLDEPAPFRSPTGLRVVKTHLKLEPIPYTPEARYICVVRDPKDVFVSSYHFARAIFLGRLMPSVAGWLDAYLSKDTPLGSWAAHLDSYWRVRGQPNVLFMTYESMRKDLPGTVDKVAAVMGVALTADERAAVIERSTFAYMKNIEHKFEPQSAPWTSSSGAMMRRGSSGGSSELITPEQQRRIDTYWQAELKRLGCDFPYATAFAVTR